MKTSEIFAVLDMAWEIRQNKQNFVPLFVGPPGVAKSYNVKAWAKRNGFKLIDCRLAYFEQTDFIGLPVFVEQNGKKRTQYALPEFWPANDEKVVLFFDEPNRGTNAVMNAIMQVLTDYRIHTYEVPQNVLIVAAINPEDGNYEVNTMDTALKDRFVRYEIDYDREDFIAYMKANDWHPSIVQFIESGSWTYVRPETVSNNPGTQYISPRTWEMLNVALKSSRVDSVLFPTLNGILGKTYAQAFHTFLVNEQPVLFSQLLSSRKQSLARLTTYSKPEDLKNAQLSITISDLVDNVDHEEFDKVLEDVVKIIPADVATGLIYKVESKRNLAPGSLLLDLCKKNSDIKKKLKNILNR